MDMINIGKGIIKIKILLLIMGFQVVYAQAIKVYVSDVATGENISNAEVRLEGYEIPPINVRYNKEGQFYYVDKVPKQYTTVMVYHKKYNEKGLQNVGGLPGELHIKLHDPLMNYNDFNYIPLKEMGDQKYYGYYIEDPYKIAVKPVKKMSYNEFRNYIYEYLEKNDLNIEPVNPVWEKYKLENGMSEQKDPYPVLETTNLKSFRDTDAGKVRQFPLNGVSSEQDEAYATYKDYVGYITFFFRKKNGEKYKRYNDPVIAMLRMNKDIQICSTIIPLGAYDGDIVKKADFIKRNTYQRKENEKLIKKYNPDLTKVFVYDSTLPSSQPEPWIPSLDIVLKEAPSMFDLVSVFSTDINGRKYKDIGGENGYSLLLIRNIMKMNGDDYFYQTTINDHPTDYSSSIGLGILDVYEYYYNQKTKNKN